MIKLSIVFLVFCLSILSCINNPKDQKTKYSLQESDTIPEEKDPWDFVNENTSEINTPDIIRILEQEKIDIVFTTHSNYIAILLENGNSYKGTYIHVQAGKYADIENLYDACNVAGYIRKNRPSSEYWRLICE